MTPLKRNMSTFYPPDKKVQEIYQDYISDIENKRPAGYPPHYSGPSDKVIRQRWSGRASVVPGLFGASPSSTSFVDLGSDYAIKKKADLIFGSQVNEKSRTTSEVESQCTIALNLFVIPS